ncbi:hypothetical protein ACI65C_002792 [Semiaphis heraclei]
MISYSSNDSYKKLVCSDVNPCLEKVLHPRNQKQVQNTKRNELQKRLLSKDDIIGVCTLASEVDGFIDDIKLFPDFYGNIEIYKSHVKELLDASSQEDFNGIKSQMTQHWSTAFLSYFDKDLNESIEATVKWKLLESGLYRNGSGITLNAAESLNAVLGRITNNIEMPTQTFIICLYHLDIFSQRNY